MARVLVVDRQTTELRIALQRGCRPANADIVTLSITRIGHHCIEPMPCDDPCRPRPRQAHEVGAGVWGGTCDPCGAVMAPVAQPLPQKVYHAVEAVSGIARFVLDDDLTEAPKGWYRAVVSVDGCDVAELMILVRCGHVAVRPAVQPFCSVGREVVG